MMKKIKQFSEDGIIHLLERCQKNTLEQNGKYIV